MRFTLLFIGFLVLDQLTKLIAQDMLAEPHWFIPEQIGFRLGFNEGIAFSLPLTGFLSIGVVLLVVTALFIWYSRVEKSLIHDVSFALVIGGALGNLVDRLRFGAVVDFLQVYSWPIFNLADSFITVGFLLLLVASARKEVS